MGFAAKNNLFELCNKYLENANWEEMIAENRPF